MAVAAMVAIATIMAFSIQMTARTGKRVADVYVKNQAEIYAKNAAEYALYKIFTSPNRCQPTAINNFVIDGIYNISVDIEYAYSNEGTCAKNYVDLQDAPDTQREYGYVKIDVSVFVDNTVANSLISEPIRVYRRYIEDITPYLQ